MWARRERAAAHRANPIWACRSSSATRPSASSASRTTIASRLRERMQRLLATLAANVGVAVQNVRLYDEARRRADEMAGLAERRPRDLGDPRPVGRAGRIADRATRLLDADAGRHVLPDHDDGGSVPGDRGHGDIAEQIRSSPVTEMPGSSATDGHGHDRGRQPSWKDAVRGRSKASPGREDPADGGAAASRGEVRRHPGRLASARGPRSPARTSASSSVFPSRRPSPCRTRGCSRRRRRRARRPSRPTRRRAVPGGHEPRDPHADERDHRHERPAARHAARRGAARLRRDDPHLGRRAADDHQRHPGLLEDRGRPDGARGAAVRPARVRSRRRSTSWRRAAAEKGLELVYAVDDDLPPRSSATPGRLRQIAPQPARQRRQVHRARRGGGDRRRIAARAARAGAACVAGRSARGPRHRHRHPGRAPWTGSSSRSARSTPRSPAATAAPASAWPSAAAWPS